MFGSVAAGAAAGAAQREYEDEEMEAEHLAFLRAESEANIGASALQNRLASGKPGKAHGSNGHAEGVMNHGGAQATSDEDVSDQPGADVAEVDADIYRFDRRSDVEPNTEEELETFLESYLKEMLEFTRNMRPWRAKIFLLQTAGGIIPFKMLDPLLLSSAYLSLSPVEHARFSQMKLSAPLSVARTIIISKFLNAFIMLVVLASIVLLCLETDSSLLEQDFAKIFVAECVSNSIFTVEIILQYLSMPKGFATATKDQISKFLKRLEKIYQILYTISFSDAKAKRIKSGKQKVPELHLLRSRPSERDLRETGGVESRQSLALGDRVGTIERRSMSSVQVGNAESSNAPQLIFLDDASVRWAWLLIDVLATLPFLLEVAIYSAETFPKGESFTDLLHRMYSWNGSPEFIRVIRLFRVLRLFKIGQKSGRVRVIWKAVVNSADGIFLLFMIVPLFVIFFSFLLFYIELAQATVVDGVWYYSNGDVSPFQSVADCFWLVIVTLTTVGYGDLVPVTSGGKVLLAVVMVLSLFIVAFPLCMITMQYSHYARLFSERKTAMINGASELRARAGSKATDILFQRPSSTFQHIDNENEGSTSTMTMIGKKVLDSLNNALGRPSSGGVASNDNLDENEASTSTITILGKKLMQKFNESAKTISLQGNDIKKGEGPPISLQTLFSPAVIENVEPESAPQSKASSHNPDENWRFSSNFEFSNSSTPKRTSVEFLNSSVSMGSSSSMYSASSSKPSDFRSSQYSSTGANTAGMKQSETMLPPIPAAGNVTGVRDVERQIDLRSGDLPKQVVIKVQDWRKDTKAERRDDVMTMRIRCNEEDAYRRLMRALADLFGPGNANSRVDRTMPEIDSMFMRATDSSTSNVDSDAIHSLQDKVHDQVQQSNRLHAASTASAHQNDYQEPIKLEQTEEEVDSTADTDWDDNDKDLETILESYLKEMLIATESMAPWRARLFIRQSAGRLISLRMLDPSLISSAYLSLSPSEHKRFSELRLSAPLTVARTILLSKLQNGLLVLFVFASIILLCIETDPKMSVSGFLGIFIAECICNLVFVLEICMQWIVIEMSLMTAFNMQFPTLLKRLNKVYQVFYTMSFSDSKAKRIVTGRDKTPKLRLSIKKPAETQHTIVELDEHPKRTWWNRRSRSLQDFENGSRMIPREKAELKYVDQDTTRWCWLFIDIAATLPFVIEVTAYGIQTPPGSGINSLLFNMYSWNGAPDFIRLLRLLRILRLFKIGQKSERVRLIWKAVANSMDGIYLLFMLVPLFVVFFSFLLFYIELAQANVVSGIWYYSDGSVAHFQSIYDCFWLVIVTLTTVGFGDVVPATAGGKILMSVVMVLSLFIVAFPLCMITMQYSHFARLFSERKSKHIEAMRRLKERLKSKDSAILHHPVIPNEIEENENSTSTLTVLGRKMMQRLARKSSKDENAVQNTISSSKSVVSTDNGGSSGAKSLLALFNPPPLIPPSDVLAAKDSAKNEEHGLSLQSRSNPIVIPSSAQRKINIGENEELPLSFSEYAKRSLPQKGKLLRSKTSPNLSRAVLHEVNDSSVITEVSFPKSELSSGAASVSGLSSSLVSKQRNSMIGKISGSEQTSNMTSGFSPRDVERQVDLDGSVPFSFPKQVVLRVQDWRLEYRADRREDVLTMRLRCKDEETYRKLMKVLAEF